MKTKVWFHAQIRWAVLEEGKRGLRSWEESAYIFLSENDETAFQQALVMGRRHESYRKEGRRLVATKLAEIVSLDCYGANPSEFMLVSGGHQKATEHLPSIIALILKAVFRPPASDANLAGGGGNSSRPTGSLRFPLHRQPPFFGWTMGKKKKANLSAY